ncbi:nicotinate phosphoribosyltransferase [Halobacteria archaeon AArc-m2/3/4]|uniref:nicotinate phosphoribosyltransferase n=1 Tax=Natronoglomus mannanivorans TaxID=2979990 RepID=A0ABT2QGB9_9EURY|nr:nicotinate phosphoribosyltransferase [Halobacteria archaeon AArc-m2/3/4]
MTETTFGYVTAENLPLFTDLYELRMMQGYYNQEHNPKATFSLFVRDLPPNRGYMVAAGLEQAIHYIETLSFGERTLEFLNEHGFDEEFLSHLAELAFTGEVRAMPEGTLAFANEPLLEVTAPIMQAQLLETVLINQIGFQSLIATKASRMRDVIDREGDGQQLVDFGSRRAHGTDAGMKAARAAYIGGFDGTSNVAAGEAFGVPISGTMAHSWIQSFEHEREAFETFVDEYGDESVLLIDTYDTVNGATVAADVAETNDVDLRGVRLDSGDLAALSRSVDEVLPGVDQFISSGVDEYAIHEFFERDGVGAGFGPGTALVTSTDAPKVEGVYKLVAVERDGRMEPTMKLSTGKVTYPGAKRVRRLESDGQYAGDVVGLRGEQLPGDSGEDVLQTVIEGGDRVLELPDVETIRTTASTHRQKLPERHRRLDDPEPYDVRIGDRLQSETSELERALESRIRDE